MSKARKRHDTRYFINYKSDKWCGVDISSVSKGATGAIASVTFKAFDDTVYTFAGSDATGAKVSLAGISDW